MWLQAEESEAGLDQSNQRLRAISARLRDLERREAALKAHPFLPPLPLLACVLNGQSHGSEQ